MSHSTKFHYYLAQVVALLASSLRFRELYGAKLLCLPKPRLHMQRSPSSIRVVGFQPKSAQTGVPSLPNPSQRQRSSSLTVNNSTTTRRVTQEPEVRHRILNSLDFNSRPTPDLSHTHFNSSPFRHASLPTQNQPLLMSTVMRLE